MTPRPIPKPGLTGGEVCVLAGAWFAACLVAVLAGTRIAARWWG